MDYRSGLSGGGGGGGVCVLNRVPMLCVQSFSTQAGVENRSVLVGFARRGYEVRPLWTSLGSGSPHSTGLGARGAEGASEFL